MVFILMEYNYFITVYSFTPPSAMPAIIYFDKNKYAIIIGTIAAVIII